MSASKTNLNKDQIDAIKFGEGPLLIIAGAGTGKTTVITERIKRIITDGLVKPEEVLALTFTEKAAGEMEGRIDEIMSLSYGDLWISTFHSFCDRVLRENGIHIGISPKYKLMTQAQSVELFKKNLFEFGLDYFRPLGNPNKFIEAILQHFNRLQDELVSLEDYLKFTKEFKNKEPLEIKKYKELSNTYKKYTEIKLKGDYMDFSDLIFYAVKLFKERPNILNEYQEKFKYILVDEFQDTNYAQNELVNLLASKTQNITVVGDDNQSIYRFRGAAISNIIQFKNTYKKAKVITLNKNYRSTQNILDAAYRLVKNNDPDTLEVKLGISKKLVSEINYPKIDVELIRTRDEESEVETVVDTINSLVNGRDKYDYKDIAILVRANNHADVFIRELERSGIPHQFLGPEKLFKRPEIVDLISYLKVLYDPESSDNMYRLLSSEIFNFKQLDLVKVMSSAKKESKSVFEIIREKDEFKKIVELIDKHLKVINSDSAGQILFDYINETGLIKRLVKESNDLAAKNIAKFFEKIKKFENENEGSSVFAVVDYIDLLIEVGEGPSVVNDDWQDQNAVNILTVHSSKGLEFPVVFLVNLVSERFPSRQRHEPIPIPNELIKEVLPEGNFHLQEERRLAYVGMTRAQKRLYLTAADYYGDAKRAKKMSPFIIESLGDDVLDELLATKNNPKEIYTKKKDGKNSVSQLEKRQIKVDFLSVSQIETFKTCPMHYKLRYIYKIPTPPSASISFGISIHNTLKDLFEEENANLISSEWILNQFRSNFIEEGYENKKHKLKFFEKGESYLKGFLSNGYDPKIKTLALEQKFTFKLASDLKIGGTIDRLDNLSDGIYEVIDYKTGANIPTQKEVDRDLQLSVYSMAISEIYKVEPENISLSLYYLDTQEKFTTRRTRADLEKVKDEILDVRKEIEESDFECNNNFYCQGKCEFSMFCKSSG